MESGWLVSILAFGLRLESHLGFFARLAHEPFVTQLAWNSVGPLSSKVVKKGSWQEGLMTRMRSIGGQGLL